MQRREFMTLLAAAAGDACTEVLVFEEKRQTL
jgi:hypothetical protein